MSQDVCFTPWVSWANRNSVLDKGKSGVYLIGRFEKQAAPGPADPFDERVVYIGESSGERFQRRWDSFERSAFGAKARHRGGMRYKERFAGDSSVLYVSTLSDKDLLKAFLGLDSCSLLDINANHPRSCITDEAIDDTLVEIDSLLIKYMERRLILLYAVANRRRPVCNAD